MTPLIRQINMDYSLCTSLSLTWKAFLWPWWCMILCVNIECTFRSSSNNVLVGRVRDINPSSCTFEGVDFRVHGLLPFWPVCAGLCFFDHLGIVLGFGCGCCKEFFIGCKVSVVAICEVAGICIRVIVMRCVRVHPVAHGSTGWHVIFFTCSGLSTLDGLLFCRGMWSTCWSMHWLRWWGSSARPGRVMRWLARVFWCFWLHPSWHSGQAAAGTTKGRGEWEWRCCLHYGSWRLWWIRHWLPWWYRGWCWWWLSCH